MADALDDLVRGLASSTRHNALAYGYSLATTGTFGALAHSTTLPTSATSSSSSSTAA
jgi:hypothetical protein